MGITNDEEISDDFVLVPTDKEPQSDDVKFWKETLSGKSVKKAHQLLREHSIERWRPQSSITSTRVVSASNRGVSSNTDAHQ